MASFAKSDHQIIRDYVTGHDHLQYSQLPEGVVCINMTHSNIERVQHPDIRLDLHTKIGDVKERFRLHIGTPVVHQRLILKDNGRVIGELSDDTKMLGFYSVTSGMEIHIIDTDPYSLSRNGGLTDVSLVQKYKMADEDYDKRSGTMRDYIRNQRKLNPNFKLGAKGADATETSLPEPAPDASTVEGITVGSRCEITPGARRGVVAFVGEIAGSNTGYWVGVRFDEPVGKSDGCVKGVRIFECEANYGGFVRGKNVKCGDYPERDLMDDDEEDSHEHGAQDDDDEI